MKGIEMKKKKTLFDLEKTTQNLLKAPWGCCVGLKEGSKVREYSVCNKYWKTIEKFKKQENAHKFARIPQMYDAIKAMAFKRCRGCFNCARDLNADDMVEYASGCCEAIAKNDPNAENCEIKQYWLLLKFVRDGK